MAIGKILIVDDDEEYANTLVTRLERSGFRTHAVYNFHSGRRALHRGAYDLALIDVRLGSEHDPNNIDGIELARMADTETAVIILTQHDTQQYAIEALEAGTDGRVPADGFIHKNEGAKAIVEKVKQILQLSRNPLRQMELENFSGLLRQHYQESMTQTKRNAQLSFWVALLMGIIFAGAVFIGFTNDEQRTISMIISISSVIMSIINFLYFSRADRANERADIIHSELAQGYRLKLLIAICENMSSESKRLEMQEMVLQQAVQNWFSNENRPFSFMETPQENE
jgi:DNA-binding response OmpR family regulator